MHGPHISFLIAANSRLFCATPPEGLRPRIGFAAAPVSPGQAVAWQIDNPSNHRIEAKRRPRVIFMAERHRRLLQPDLRGKEVAKQLPLGCFWVGEHHRLCFA
jgi:hypothetical protein